MHPLRKFVHNALKPCRLLSGFPFHQLHHLLQRTQHSCLVYHHDRIVFILSCRLRLRGLAKNEEKAFELFIGVRHDASVNQVKNQGKKNPVHRSVESHLHPRKQRAHIVGNRVNIISPERSKPQGKSKKGAQNSKPGKHTGNAGIKIGHAHPVQKFFTDIFLQITSRAPPLTGRTFDTQAVFIESTSKFLTLKDIAAVLIVLPKVFPICFFILFLEPEGELLQLSGDEIQPAEFYDCYCEYHTYNNQKAHINGKIDHGALVRRKHTVHIQHKGHHNRIYRK